MSNSSGDELIGRAIAHGKRAGNLDMGGLAAALLILAGKSSLRRLLSDGTAEIGGKRYVVAFDTVFEDHIALSNIVGSVDEGAVQDINGAKVSFPLLSGDHMSATILNPRGMVLGSAKEGVLSVETREGKPLLGKYTDAFSAAAFVAACLSDAGGERCDTDEEFEMPDGTVGFVRGSRLYLVDGEDSSPCYLGYSNDNQVFNPSGLLCGSFDKEAQQFSLMFEKPVGLIRDGIAYAFFEGGLIEEVSFASSITSLCMAAILLYPYFVPLPKAESVVDCYPLGRLTLRGGHCYSGSGWNRYSPLGLVDPPSSPRRRRACAELTWASSSVIAIGEASAIEVWKASETAGGLFLGASDVMWAASYKGDPLSSAALYSFDNPFNPDGAIDLYYQIKEDLAQAADNITELGNLEEQLELARQGQTVAKNHYDLVVSEAGLSDFIDTSRESLERADNTVAEASQRVEEMRSSSLSLTYDFDNLTVVAMRRLRFELQSAEQIPNGWSERVLASALLAIGCHGAFGGASKPFLSEEEKDELEGLALVDPSEYLFLDGAPRVISFSELLHDGSREAIDVPDLLPSAIDTESWLLEDPYALNSLLPLAPEEFPEERSVWRDGYDEFLRVQLSAVEFVRAHKDDFESIDHDRWGNIVGTILKNTGAFLNSKGYSGWFDEHESSPVYGAREAIGSSNNKYSAYIIYLGLVAYVLRVIMRKAIPSDTMFSPGQLTDLPRALAELESEQVKPAIMIASGEGFGKEAEAVRDGILHDPSLPCPCSVGMDGDLLENRGQVKGEYIAFKRSLDSCRFFADANAEKMTLVRNKRSEETSEAMSEIVRPLFQKYEYLKEYRRDEVHFVEGCALAIVASDDFYVRYLAFLDAIELAVNVAVRNYLDDKEAIFTPRIVTRMAAALDGMQHDVIGPMIEDLPS